MTEGGNWGRWGDTDQRGTLNLTPARVAEAAGLVRAGRAVSLGIPVGRHTPAYPDRLPVEHFMLTDGGDFAFDTRPEFHGVESVEDVLHMPVHSGTHVDAFCHVWRDGKLYNGFDRSQVRSSGARVLDAAGIGPIVTRGVLLDLPATLGVPCLAAGQIVTREEVQAAVPGELRPGDAVLIRTGWLEAYRREDRRAWAERQPGIGYEAARWLATQDPALVGADNIGVEAMPSDPAGGGGPVPVHVLLLRDHGIHLLELVDLSVLAAEGVREFLFVAAPLPLVRASGGPVNPVAMW